MVPSSQALQEGFRRFLAEMADFFAGYSFLREAESGLRDLAENTRRPFNVAICGRMKAGKSTLINALVGQPIAITGVEEATATINWISFGDESQAKTFVVHWRDGRSEPLPLSRLGDWAGKDQAVLSRVRSTSYLELFANAPALKHVQVIDTPGSGSVAEEHEEAAASFLDPRAAADSVAEGRKADALIYVFPPVARERDQESLALYRQSCIPGSDPYNSVGVLHKWDALADSENILDTVESKAGRLREALSGVVADVIPVSGPIAMFSRHAADDVYARLSDVLEQSDAAASLRTDSRWDRDDIRRSLRMAAGLPWASFRQVAQLYLRQRPGNASEFRSLCREFSQIDRLERFLDQRFFSQAAIIKQRQGRMRAKALIEPAFDLLSRRIDTLREDLAKWRQLQATTCASAGLPEWVHRKAEECAAELDNVRNASVSADRFWRDERDRMEGLDRDLQVARMIDCTPGFVDPADAAAIRRLCECLCGESSDRRSRIGRIVSLDELTLLRRRYSALTQFGDHNLRSLYSHLCRRLVEASAALVEDQG